LAERYVVSGLLGHHYETTYDSLIVAAGANQSYFGNDHFAEFAPGMKTVDDALEVRGRILGDGTTRRIDSACKVWSAGVSASPLGAQIAEQSGAEVDRAGRVKVLPDLTVPGHPNVYVIGDMASVPGVPGMAQGAIQGARYAARAIKTDLKGACPPLPEPFHCAAREPFQYFDKGSMATVSRFSAVAKVGSLELAGLVAWLAWLLLHLVYLVGFKTKLTTFISWGTTFLTLGKGQLTITERQTLTQRPIEQSTQPEPAAEAA
jgi:NADH dehydrogenase